MMKLERFESSKCRCVFAYLHFGLRAHVYIHVEATAHFDMFCSKFFVAMEHVHGFVCVAIIVRTVSLVAVVGKGWSR